MLIRGMMVQWRRPMGSTAERSPDTEFHVALALPRIVVVVTNGHQMHARARRR